MMEGQAMRLTTDPVVNEVDRHAWPSILSEFEDCNFEQTDAYAAVAAARSGSAARFYTISKGNQLLGAASVRVKTIPPLGRGFAYISGGPMTHSREASIDPERSRVVLDALKTKLVDEEGYFLFVRMPISPAFDRTDAERVFSRYRATSRVRSYRTFVIDLSGGIDALRADLYGRWRRHLKFSEQSGLHIEQGSSPEMIQRFLILFNQMHEVKRFPIRMNPELLLDLPSDSLGLCVLIATQDGQDVAGHVVSILGDTEVYLFGATNESGRAARAGYLLHWRSVLLGKERDSRWYDLGGVDADENFGGFSFKKGMGGRELAAIGPYEAQPAGGGAFLIDKLLGVRDRVQRYLAA
jgi:lipid II:glycine glycyltransferase (peptidoglycan interpeptide bridge formation enzyme)